MRLCVCALALHAAAAAAQLPPADAPGARATLNDTRCGPECVICAVDGCVKCARLLVWPGGACADHCPPGTREGWARDNQLLGRVCYPTTNHNEVIIGSACGIALCVALVAALGAWLRCRGRAPQPQPLPQRPDDDAKLRQFHKQLDCLRPHAYTLLSVLNHTRNQVRELYQLGNNDAAVAYSCVLSDLAKLLILLNKQHVPVVPQEWPRLACWAERVIKRHTRTNDGQEIFATCPSQSESEATTQSFSTFKPSSYSPSSYDSSKEPWADGRPPSYSQVEREFIGLAGPWQRHRPVVRRESVWLEDEIFSMTKRPQDELTTEL